MFFFFFFQAEDGIRDVAVTGVQTCALPIWVREIHAFHLNDSVKPLGCRVDRHECVCEGEIGPLAFRNLVNDERFREVPGYLEIPPEGNRECLLRLKKLRVTATPARRLP